MFYVYMLHVKESEGIRMPHLVAGVDAGNSKTWALVGDREGRALGWGTAGRGNHQAPEVGPAGAGQAFQAALRGALPPGHGAADLDQAAFCLAGADFPSDFALLADVVRGRWPHLRFTIYNDALAGLRAGTSRGWGAAVVCGSGTNAVGRGKDGRPVQVGGMGYLSGDFGGGGDLGRAALRAAAQAAQGRGPATALQGLVLAELGQPDMDTLARSLYAGRLRPAWALDLAPLVFQAAAAGDGVAQDLLVQMGTELGKAGAAALQAVGLDREPGAEVVMAGSVWKGGSPLLLDAATLALHRVAPRAVWVRPRYEPVVGAYLLALEGAGVTVGPAVQANLDATLPAGLRLDPDR